MSIRPVTKDEKEPFINGVLWSAVVYTLCRYAHPIFREDSPGTEYVKGLEVIRPGKNDKQNTFTIEDSDGAIFEVSVIMKTGTGR